MITGRVEDRNHKLDLNKKGLTDLIKKVADIEKEIKFLVKDNGNGYEINQDLLNASNKLTPENLLVLNTVVQNISNIRMLVSDISNVNYVGTHRSIYESLVANISSVVDVSENMDFIKDLKSSMCITVSRSKSFAMRAKDYKEQIEKFYSNKIKPDIFKLENELTAALARLNQGITEIEASHIDARDWYNSDIRIKIKKMCYECSPFTTHVKPIYNIDGSVQKRGTVTFNIPKPICSKTINADSGLVKESVDLYLKELPNVGGEGGSIINLSQEELNALVDGA